MRLAVITSHPIQYYAPVFRVLAKKLELEVFYAHRATAQDQSRAGFDIPFDWDVDLLSGYHHTFLRNVAKAPATNRFYGCDTPEISQHLLAGGFEAVLVLGWYLKAFIQATVAAKRAGIPVLVRGDSHLRTPAGLVKKLTKRVAYPVALRAFDAALYVGRWSREYFVSYGVPSERLFFSPHCVDTGWFGEHATTQMRSNLRAECNIAEHESVALFAGKLTSLKRPLDLIAAAEVLARLGRPVTIMVAGSGPLEGEMRSRADQSGVKLVLLGFRNQTAMPGCYAASDLVVLPSERETWGLVANEALACGRPIVASDAAGCAPDLAADGTAGRIFPAGDRTLLANAIAGVLDSPPTRVAILEKSERYSVGGACDGILEALRYVTSRR